VPAQAKPAAAPPALAKVIIVNTAGLLDWKVMGALTAFFPASSAAAVNESVSPTSSEPTVGETSMMVGTGVGGLLLLLPHPVRAERKTRLTMTSNTSPDLPMNPPRPAVMLPDELSLCWKTLSVEAEDFFSKLRRSRGVRAACRNLERFVRGILELSHFPGARAQIADPSSDRRNLI